MARSILGLVSGCFAVAIMGFALEYVLGPNASGATFVLGTLFQVVVGGYVAAFVAARAETAHALGFGVVILVVFMVTILLTAVHPLLDELPLLVGVLPAAFAGGWLRARQGRRQGTRDAADGRR